MVNSAHVSASEIYYFLLGFGFSFITFGLWRHAGIALFHSITVFAGRTILEKVFGLGAEGKWGFDVFMVIWNILIESS